MLFCLFVCLLVFLSIFSLSLSLFYAFWLFEMKSSQFGFRRWKRFFFWASHFYLLLQFFYGCFFVCLRGNKFEFIKKLYSSSNKWYNFLAKLQTHKKHFQLIFQYFYFLDWKNFARNWIIVKPSTDIPQI